jgi:hypothetical protein
VCGIWKISSKGIEKEEKEISGIGGNGRSTNVAALLDMVDENLG